MNAEDYYKIICIYELEHGQIENYIVRTEYTISDSDYSNAREMYEKMKREEQERQHQLLVDRENVINNILQQIGQKINNIGIDVIFNNILTLEDYYLNQCKHLKSNIKKYKNKIIRYNNKINEIKRRRKEEYVNKRKMLSIKINNYEKIIETNEKDYNFNINEYVKYRDWKEQIIDNGMIDIYDHLGNYDFEGVNAFLKFLETF